MYFIAFENGSSGYLSHHGIKGMKWGVWNEETRARRLGSYRNSRKSAKKRKLSENVKQAAIEYEKNPTSKNALDLYDAATRKVRSTNPLYKKQMIMLGASAVAGVVGGSVIGGLTGGPASIGIGGYFGGFGGIVAAAVGTQHITELLEREIADVVESEVKNGKKAVQQALHRIDSMESAPNFTKRQTLRKEGQLEHIRRQELVEKAWKDLSSAQKDFDQNHPTILRLKKEYKAGKIKKNDYNSAYNRAWLEEIDNPNSKYRKAYDTYGFLKDGKPIHGLSKLEHR